MARLLGHRTVQELLAATPDLYQVFADPARWEHLVDATERAGLLTGIEEELRRVDGGSAWASIIVTPSGDRGISILFSEEVPRRQAQADLARGTRMLELLMGAAVAANGARNLEEAVTRILDLVCEATGWPVGHALLMEEGSAEPIVSMRLWHLDDAQHYEAFRRASEGRRFAVGVGLPGRVLDGGAPVWITDVTRDANFPRVGSAGDVGLRAAFGFPVLVGKDVVAVLEFFSTSPQRPDEAVLEVMGSVGTQLGRVVERTKADEHLRGAEARYRTLVESLPRFMYIAPFDDTPPFEETEVWPYVSPQVERMLGFAPDEWRADPSLWTRLTHPDDLERVLADEAVSQRTGAPFHAEYRMFARDGRTVWVQDEAVVVRGEDGTPQLLQGVMVDISRRKETEEPLREAEVRYRTLVETLPAFTYVAPSRSIRSTSDSRTGTS